jgi:hypothetical protein
VTLDTKRVGRDAASIAEEIIQHLVLQPGASVEVTLEIEAVLPRVPQTSGEDRDGKTARR